MPTTLLPAAWRRTLPWVAALAVALIAALSVVVHRSTTAFDTWTFRELYAHIGTGPASLLLGFSSPGLSIGMLGIVALFAAMLRRWDVAALAAIAPALAIVLTREVLKPLIDRPLIIGQYAAHGVFPSGHETAVSAAALVLLIVARQLPLSGRARGVVIGVLVVWMLVAAVGLVRNFWHYATDTIGGVCVSVAVVSAVALAIDRVSSRAARSPARTTRAA